MASFDDRMRRRARLSAAAKILFAVFAFASIVGGMVMRGCRSLERTNASEERRDGYQR